MYLKCPSLFLSKESKTSHWFLFHIKYVVAIKENCNRLRNEMGLIK